jgi:hypothetical protein
MLETSMDGSAAGRVEERAVRGRAVLAGVPDPELVGVAFARTAYRSGGSRGCASKSSSISSGFGQSSPYTSAERASRDLREILDHTTHACEDER